MYFCIPWGILANVKISRLSAFSSWLCDLFPSCVALGLRPRTTHEGNKSHKPSLQANNPYVAAIAEVHDIDILGLKWWKIHVSDNKDFLDLERSNDAMGKRTLFKKWIWVLSAFIAIIPIHLFCQMQANPPKENSKGPYPISEEK